MVGTFLYLTACSAKNRIHRRLRRLREPRYIVGLVVGLLYLYFVMFRRDGPSHFTSGTAAQSAFHLAAGPMQFIGSVVLLVFSCGAWLLPGSGRPIAFSRPEVQFLFTAPVTRRGLLHYKLLRSQIGMIVGSVVATLLMRPGSAAQSWTFLIGLWLLMAVVRLHLIGVALSRNSIAEHGRSGRAHQWLPVSCVVGGVGVLVFAAIQGWPTVAASKSAAAAFAALQQLAGSGMAGVVLWPFRALARLPLSETPAEFWQRLPAVLVLLAGHYLWVMRSDAAFEEASAEQAERQVRARTPSRPASRAALSAPFHLAPHGPPEFAILWKNLILLGRYVSIRTLWRALPLFVVVVLVARNLAGAGGLAAFLAVLCVPLTAITVLLGPQLLRNDLRQDLANLAVLKTWPLRGAAIVRGEVMAPTAVASLLAWLFILAGAVLAGRLPIGPAASDVFMSHRGSGAAASSVIAAAEAFMSNRASVAVAAALLASALILAQTVIHNAAVVLFPAWVTVGASHAGGVDAMGQRLLLMAGVTMTLVVMLIPAAAAAAAAAVLVSVWLTGAPLIVVPAVIVALVVAAECWLVTEMLGRVFDRTDVSSVEA